MSSFLSFSHPSLLHLHPPSLSCHCTHLRCQDYTLIDRGSFGTTELCGNTTLESEFGSLEQGNFQVFFRSSEITRGRGFRMLVVCFKPEERDRPGDLTDIQCMNATCLSTLPASLPVSVAMSVAM